MRLLVALTLSLLTPAPAGTAVPAAGGTGVVRFVNAGTGDCLDANNGADVRSLACNREAGKPEDGWQLWHVEDISRATGVPGTFMIRNDHERYDRRCLTARGPRKQDALLTPCAPGDSGQWWTFDGARILAYRYGKAALYDEAGTLHVRVARDARPGVNTRWCRRAWPTQKASCDA
ncbi:ricin-type beta-trefoil lectin domain protein [Nonomuraea sp. NPDC049637]|uniref:ricin-type beta-trefoil lectin domain protein n=1 Tax=Nonomuraea sp. NPDC049637 TaxID=3154356 RepID=UPI00343DCB02